MSREFTSEVRELIAQRLLDDEWNLRLTGPEVDGVPPPRTLVLNGQRYVRETPRCDPQRLMVDP